MNVLVLGGTGMVGRQVVRALLERGGPRVTATSRSGSGPTDGVRWVAADLERPETLPAAFEGQDRLYLLTPLHPDEVDLGMAAVVAAENAGVSRIVLHSVFRAEAYPDIPHFRSKVVILDAIRDSGIPWTAIKPNNYFQNDVALLDGMLQHGVYATPLGSKGVTRVDTRDIGEVAARALIEDGHVGLEVPLNGFQALTGPQVAKTWARHLEREIRYGGDDVDAWADRVAAFLPPWLVDDLTKMFRMFVDDGFRGTEEDLATQSHVLGHAPRVFDDFAAEVAEAYVLRPGDADPAP